MGVWRIYNDCRWGAVRPLSYFSAIRHERGFKFFRKHVNAGLKVQRLAGAKVQQRRKQEGPRYRGPSCLLNITPEALLARAALPLHGGSGVLSVRA